ncbi:TonB-dependent receptor [Arsukibacterium indicum]|uniref:TonB-dependent receptor n=1 Tax=Arsukibacterium indicum TaxID=2848612 RepID=A0ABS6MP75_9GAMM|nr:TonB-dependent receptor [Arsukibacterium indicum]MBV2130612.1 TonB-dependent receptor [Arsukibacterium indicum]
MTNTARTIAFSKAPLALAVSSALFLSCNVHAQQNADDTEKEAASVERITVTASRRPQTVEETPYNISVISGSQLEEKHIIDAVDMMREMSGITVVDRGYRNSGVINNIVIRGMNIDSAGNGDFALNAAPTVSTYLNDTPLFANFILKDIDAVEVLRGPQGTLYGSGSLAGTVRYKMNRPDLRGFSGKVSAVLSQSQGSDGVNRNLDLLLNSPLSETVAVRGYLGRIDNDGIVDYVNVYQLNAAGAPVAQDNDVANGRPVFTSVEDADTVEIDYGRLALLWQPSDTFNALVWYQFQQDNIGARRQVTRGTNWVDGTEQPYGDYQNGAVQLEPSERDVDAWALEMEWDLGFATATSSTSGYDHVGSSTSDNSGFYAQNGWFSSYYGGSPRPMASANRFYQDKGLSQELRLVSNGKQSLDWIVGLFYLDQDTASGQDSLMPGFSEWALASGFADTLASWGGVLGDQDFYYRDQRNIKDTSVFGELTYHFSDTLRTTLGARHFRNDISNDTVIDLPLYPGASNVSSSVKDNGTLFKVNLAYDWSEHTMLYATISEGYRRGGTSAVPVTGGFAENPAYLNYDSDSVLNMELGIKGNTGRHFYSLSVFNAEWDDPQLNIPTPNWGFYAAVNGESANSRGIELELRGYFTEALQYNFGYTFVDAKLTDDLIAPAGSAATPRTYVYARKGEQLPSMAEHTVSAGLSHSFDLGSGYYLVSSASTYYQSESRNALGRNPVFAIDLNSFWLTNLGTSLYTENWTFSLFVRNLFNEEGVTGTLSEGYMGTAPEQNFYGNASKDYISQPRTVGLSVSYQF